MTLNPPIEAFALSMPITTTTRAIADRFAQLHSNPQKAEQVRLNTLAVCIVNDYLQLLAIPTDLKASDSWNPLIQHCSDTADLLVPQIGYLECRPLRSDAAPDSCFVPPEVWENRVGYVVVQLDEAEREGVILGFCPRISQTQLPLSRLQPIEAIVDVLNPPITQLSRWLQNQFDQGWQTVESLLNPPQLGYASRSRRGLEDDAFRGVPEVAASRGRLIDLSTSAAARSVVLTLDMIEVSATQTTLQVRVFPTDDRPHLFPTLELAILDDLNQTFQVVAAQALDDYIQLQFNGEPQERFSVRLTLDDVSVTETFVI
jgi:Protein of unknown function (DUF1822)